MLKCLFVNTHYSGFLSSHYAEFPRLAECSYAEQLASLDAANFGDSDFYSAGLRQAGWLSADIVVNCDPLQKAWARENGLLGDGLQVAVEQAKRFAPDVVYVQDMNAMPRAFLDAIRPKNGLVVGQIATTVGAQIPFDAYDVIVSSMPHLVDQFHKMGRTAYCQPLAFAPRVLTAVGRKPWRERGIDVSFVGGLSPVHTQGIELLTELVKGTSIVLWGYGAETLPPSSPLKARHRGEAWGTGMFAKLGDSKLTVNRHADYAGRFANNMRLFEATGSGALLITDHKDNLDDLFVIGKEVVAYRSVKECVALVQYFLNHPDEAEQIARAGTARTLRDHSYAKRMEHTGEFLKRHLRYRRDSSKWSVLPAEISSGYRSVAASELRDEHRQAWHHPSIPAQQRALVQSELESMYKGRPPRVFQGLATALTPWLRPGEKLLEVGCASGYYFEALEYLMKQRIDYTGVDFSEPLIAMAKDFYGLDARPSAAKFVVADGSRLPFADNSVEVVVSGCVLLHVEDWRGQLREAARVASRAVVLHRTPVKRQGPTTLMLKRAYGVETFEYAFSEAELLSACRSFGLLLRTVTALEENASADHFVLTYTLEKVKNAQPVLTQVAS